MLSRRHFLGASLATSMYAVGSFVPVWAQSAPNFGTPALPTPGFRRMKVGDVEVVSLIDGIARRPLGEEFVKNAPLAEVRALLASQGLDTGYIDVPFTPFLVISGGRKILMDTGLGEFGGPNAGKLLDNLRAAGVQPGEIDTVLISHYHGDHITGLRSKAGVLNFPNAKVMVPTVEHAFWMEAAPKTRREMFARITASNAMVGGFHFPFPAFGSMVASGNGYAFQPAG